MALIEPGQESRMLANNCNNNANLDGLNNAETYAFGQKNLFLMLVSQSFSSSNKTMHKRENRSN